MISAAATLTVVVALALSYFITTGPIQRRPYHWWRPIVALVYAAIMFSMSVALEGFNPLEWGLAWLQDRGVVDLLARVQDFVPESVRAFFAEGGQGAEWIEWVWRAINRGVGVAIAFGYLFFRMAGSVLIGMTPFALRRSAALLMTQATHEFRDGQWFVLRQHRYLTAMVMQFTFLSFAALSAQWFGWRSPSEWDPTVTLPALLFIFFYEVWTFLGGRHRPYDLPVEAHPSPREPWLRDVTRLAATYERVWSGVSLALAVWHGAGERAPRPPLARERLSWWRRFLRFLRSLFGGRRAAITPAPGEPDAVRDTEDLEPLLPERLRAGEDVLIVDHLPVHFAGTLRDHLVRSIWSGHRVVFLVEHEGLIDHTRATLRRLFGGFPIRAVRVDDPDLHESDILVLTVRQRVNERIRRHVAGHPCLLIVADANATILWHSHEVRALREELLELSERLPQVIAFADWQVSLEAALRSAMGFGIRAIRPKPHELPTAVMVWPTPQVGMRPYESSLLPAGLLVRATPEAALVVPVLEDGADEVRLVMQSRLPVAEALGSLSNVQDQWTSFHGVARLDDHKVQVVPAAFTLHAVDAQTEVVIVRDENADLIATAKKWASLSIHGTLVHVVSPPYLLRHLFVQRLSGDPLTRRSAFSALAPEVDAGSRFQRCYDLFRRLERSWVNTAEVVEELRFIDDDAHRWVAIDERLKRAFAEHLELRDLNKYPEYRDRFDVALDGKLVRLSEMRLGAGGARPALDWMQPITIVAPETQAPLLAIEYAGEFHQRYLPLQTHAFDGRRAVRIVRVDLPAGVARTSAVSVDAGAWREHVRQDRTYALGAEQARLVERIRLGDDRRMDVDLAIFEVPLTVTTNGYLAFLPQAGLSLHHATFEPIFPTPEADDRVEGDPSSPEPRPIPAIDEAPDPTRFVPRRRYRKGKVLRIRFGRLPEGVASEALPFTLALLFSESLRSYFPHLHPYLSIAIEAHHRPQGDDPFTQRLGMMVNALEHPIAAKPGEYLDVFLIEDSHFDRGALRAFARNFVSIILPDLRAALAIAEDDDFLRFGSVAIPDVLAVREALDLLERLPLTEAFVQPVAQHRPPPPPVDPPPAAPVAPAPSDSGTPESATSPAPKRPARRGLFARIRDWWRALRRRRRRPVVDPSAAAAPVASDPPVAAAPVVVDPPVAAPDPGPVGAAGPLPPGGTPAGGATPGIEPPPDVTPPPADDGSARGGTPPRPDPPSAAVDPSLPPSPVPPPPTDGTTPGDAATGDPGTSKAP